MKWSYKKINSKRVIDLNERVKTNKLLETNTRAHVHVVRLCSGFLDTAAKA